MTTGSDDPLDRRDQKSGKTLRLRSLSSVLTVADVEARHGVPAVLGVEGDYTGCRPGG